MILKRPRGGWLAVEAENVSPFQSNLHIRFSGAGRMVEVTVGLFPRWPVRIGLPLEAASGRELFLARQPGVFKTLVAGGHLAPADIERIELAGPADCESSLRIDRAWVCEDPPQPLPPPSRPIVDRLYQWTRRDWPGKATDCESVRAELESELRETPQPACAGRSVWGGWLGRQWEGTGAFRVHHDGRRWWLVDPSGHPFWSAGMNCVAPSVAFPAEGMEGLVEGGGPSPSERPDLWRPGPDRPQFDAGVYNLERVLGVDWRGRWEELTRRRLVASGLNTLGNWSDSGFGIRSGLPRVLTLRGYPRTSALLFRDFPDVFAAEFQASAEAYAAQLCEVGNDPAILGYFMGNEPQWAFVEGLDLAECVLAAGSGTATHAAFVEWLGSRYSSAARVGETWGHPIAGWFDFEAPMDVAGLPGARSDLEAFTRIAVERYVSLPAAACRRAAPSLLNLGLRWAWIHSEYQFAGAEEIDVFSVNCYQTMPDPALFDRIAAATGRPVLIGEFHFGSLDRGLPCGGIRAVPTLRESVEAFGYYLQLAAAHPAIVGAHYFKWTDQHVLGRFDGENMQIGWVDITGRIYPEWRAGARPTLAELYVVA